MIFARPLRQLFGKRPAPFGAPKGAPQGEVPGGIVRLAGRRVRVRPFGLDLRPVTNAEWAAFVGSTERSSPPWMYRPGWASPAQPVVGITYAEARAFAAWAHKRLPSEAEWARAAQSADGPWPWGGSDPNIRHAWFGQGAGGAPAECDAESRAPGDGAFGHRDLFGNVWEWCAGGVLRGGFWGSPQLDPGMRLIQPPTARSAGFGLRLARQ